MAKCVERLMNGWEDRMKVDKQDEMTNVGMAIAGKTLHNTDIKKEATEINQALEIATSLFGRESLPLTQWLLQVTLTRLLRFYRAKARLDNIISKILDECRRNKGENRDLASLLLGGGMSYQQVRDEAVTFLLTAFDT